MFELYFSAFDILLYGAAFIVAICDADAICARADQRALDVHQKSASQTPLSQPSAMHPPDLATLEKEVEIVISPATTTEYADQVLSVDASATTPAESDLEASSEVLQPSIELGTLKLYKLHQKLVVAASALPFEVPETIKRYRLRGDDVVRIEALESLACFV